MKTILKNEGRYYILKSIEAEHYLNKLDDELFEKLESAEKEAMTYGAISTLWSLSHRNKEDINSSITWTIAQICILELAGIIKESTYEGLKEELHKIRKELYKTPF